ncbi:MAG TPA: L,D-transpeptidase family protein [Gaiellaceae bacterium]|jgi:lipoprotein-anchoring transpeptidase ErfK/SrfK|nr:L,D-transpeptidase family protein [Gaiellaceae bacterium]
MISRIAQCGVLAVAGVSALAVFAGASAAATSKHAVPSGVRIAGIRVGGLTPGAATKAVKTAFSAPLPLVIDGTKVELHPAKLASAYIDPAVGQARSASHGTNVHLVVSAHGAAIRAAVDKLASRFSQKPRNASLGMVAGRPRVKPELDGISLDRSVLLQRIVHSLTANSRRPISLQTKKTLPAITAASLGPMILINRAANRLTLFHSDNTVWRVFNVATGQSIYPTPAGRFSIVVKWVDPTWYPPTQDAWAAGLSPVPPGPGNPLGTRWMGLSAPGVGIHGTDEPDSIGSNASHGCIRMQVPDSEWLFSRVRVGTSVFIV